MLRNLVLLLSHSFKAQARNEISIVSRISSNSFPKSQRIFPITNYQFPITNYRLPITDYRLPITNYQLPINKDDLFGFSITASS
ncbi:conserved hypothetical protein, secreted [Beggiatoa sp. PS]|nr:conserved hypothetical protein, secreted [Beggiatoa sp. PS]